MMVLLLGDGTRQHRTAVKQSCHSLFIRAERRDVSLCKGARGLVLLGLRAVCSSALWAECCAELSTATGLLPCECCSASLLGVHTGCISGQGLFLL